MRRLTLLAVGPLMMLGPLSTSGCSNAECERIIQEAISVGPLLRSETCNQDRERDRFAAGEISFEEMQEQIFASRDRIVAAEQKIQLQVSECPEGNEAMMEAAIVAGSRPC